MTKFEIVKLIIIPGIGYLVAFFQAFRTIQRWLLKKRYLEGHWSGKLICNEDRERYLNLDIYISLLKGDLNEGILMYEQHRNSKGLISKGADSFICSECSKIPEFETKLTKWDKFKTVFAHRAVLRFDRLYDDPGDEPLDTSLISYWHYFRAGLTMRLFTVQVQVTIRSRAEALSFTGVLTRKSS